MGKKAFASILSRNSLKIVISFQDLADPLLLSLLPGPSDWSEIFSPDDARVLGSSLLNDLQLLFLGSCSKLSAPDGGPSVALLTDLVWERLNCGHWTDVSDAWRRAFSLLTLCDVISRLCEPRLGFTELKALLADLDHGLLMGAPVLENRLAALATCLHDRAVRLAPPELFDDLVLAEERASEHEELAELAAFGGPHLTPLPRLEAPSIEAFQRLVSSAQPAVLTHCLQHWPAPTSWSVTELCRRAGLRTVPVEVGSSYADDEWAQRRMPLMEFARQFVLLEGEAVGAGKGYLAQHQLFQQVPELLDDIPVPDYCYCLEEGKVDANIWFGPKGTVSPAHHDPRNNLLAQVKGSKYVQLFAVNQTEGLYPHPGSLLGNTSQVDVENPDTEKFPNFTRVEGMHGILRPGEMLFIPQRYWHYVRSLSISISVNFWFD